MQYHHTREGGGPGCMHAVKSPINLTEYESFRFESLSRLKKMKWRRVKLSGPFHVGIRLEEGGGRERRVFCARLPNLIWTYLRKAFSSFVQRYWVCVFFRIRVACREGNRVGSPPPSSSLLLSKWTLRELSFLLGFPSVPPSLYLAVVAPLISLFQEGATASCLVIFLFGGRRCLHRPSAPCLQWMVSISPRRRPMIIAAALLLFLPSSARHLAPSVRREVAAVCRKKRGGRRRRGTRATRASLVDHSLVSLASRRREGGSQT